MEAWVRIAAQGNNGGDGAYFMFGQNCQVYLEELSAGFAVANGTAKSGDLGVWNTGAQKMYDSHLNIANGKTHFVVLDYNTSGSGAIILYVDAKKVASFRNWTTYRSCPSSSPATSAGWGPLSVFPEHINESISDLAFFRNNLTQKQITAQYSAGRR